MTKRIMILEMTPDYPDGKQVIEIRGYSDVKMLEHYVMLIMPGFDECLYFPHRYISNMRSRREKS